MLRHYLLIAYRNFTRYKTTFLINVIGLSTGIACCLLILLWVNDESSVDKFHSTDARLFQVFENNVANGRTETQKGTGFFLAESLKNDFAEIENAVVTTPAGFFPSFSLSVNNSHVKGIGKFADREFFSIFSYPIRSGNSDKALDDKNSIAISSTLAVKLFNDSANCIGKSIEYKLFDITRTVTVSAVFDDVPPNASEHFDFVIPFDSFKEIMGMTAASFDWDGSGPFSTYILLHENVNVAGFNRKLNDYLITKGKNSNHRSLFAEAYSDNYLFSDYENGVQSGGRITYVRLFLGIAIFILVIACINFTNLATARSSIRTKEIAVKKSIGVKRKSLIMQYLSESFAISVLSTLIAVLIADLCLNKFNEITGKQLSLSFDIPILLTIGGIILVTGLMAGGYPALYLSGFHPVSILKNKITSTSLADTFARKGLVIFQFSLSVTFIVAVLVLYRQIEFIQTKNPGYNAENILTFEAEGKVVAHPEDFLSEIKKISGVVSTSSMIGNLVRDGSGMPTSFDYNGRKIVLQSSAVSYDLLETFGLQIKEGRSFSSLNRGDTSKVILNEAAVEALGWDDPVGKRMPGGAEVIGVVRNFHFQSLHQPIQPFAFRLEPHYAVTIVVRVNGQSTASTVGLIKEFYSKYNPGYNLDVNFLDQELQLLYSAEQRVSSLSRYFAAIAILISCLGLFGLATFSAERRQKEIGIRKVLGASEISIIRLLTNDFTVLIFASAIIGLPLAYWVGKQWLATFAYRIELEWWYFAGAALTTLIISWLTIGIQTIRTARLNPVDYLKCE